MREGITHVLCVAPALELLYPELVTYRRINVLDSASENITAHFDQCFDFIDAVRYTCVYPRSLQLNREVCVCL